MRPDKDCQLSDLLSINVTLDNQCMNYIKFNSEWSTTQNVKLIPTQLFVLAENGSEIFSTSNDDICGITDYAV